MDAQVQSRVVQAAQHLPFEVVALVLQGGGALGAYQAGVYDAPSEAGIQPNWIAGMSIGAINAAIMPAMRRMTGSIGCLDASNRMDRGRAPAMHASISRGATPCVS